MAHQPGGWELHVCLSDFSLLGLSFALVMTQCDPRVDTWMCICGVFSWLLRFPFISIWEVITFLYISWWENDLIGQVMRKMALSLTLTHSLPCKGQKITEAAGDNEGTGLV